MLKTQGTAAPEASTEVMKGHLGKGNSESEQQPSPRSRKEHASPSFGRLCLALVAELITVPKSPAEQ